MDEKLEWGVLDLQVETHSLPDACARRDDAKALCDWMTGEVMRQCAAHSAPPPLVVMFVCRDVVKLFRLKSTLPPVAVVGAIAKKMASEFGAEAGVFVSLCSVTPKADTPKEEGAPIIAVYAESANGKCAIQFQRPLLDKQGKLTRFMLQDDFVGAKAVANAPFGFFRKEEEG